MGDYLQKKNEFMFHRARRDQISRKRKIAEASGGRAYFPGSLKDLGQVWRDIAGGIRSQYTIGYRSSDPNRDGTFRKVKITAGRNGGNGLRVTTRPGYIAAK